MLKNYSRKLKNSEKNKKNGKAKLEKINNSVQEYQNSFINKNLNKFFAKVVKSTMQIDTLQLHLIV